MNKIKDLFTKIYDSCNELKNSRFFIEGVSIKFKENNIDYHFEFDSAINKKTQKKEINILLYFDEIKEKINFADIRLEKYIEKHLKKFDEILNKVI